MNRRSFLKAIGVLMGAAVVAPIEAAHILAPHVNPSLALAEIDEPTPCLGTFFKIDGLDLSEWLTSLSVDEQRQRIDVTSWGDDEPQFMEGLTEASVNVGLIGLPWHTHLRLLEIVTKNEVVGLEMGIDGWTGKCSAMAKNYGYGADNADYLRGTFNLRALSTFQANA